MIECAPLRTGDVVGLRYHLAPGLDLFFASRVVDVFDAPDGGVHRTGFRYRTLVGHPEIGEETFSVETHLTSGVVQVALRSWSRPRSVLARLGSRVRAAISGGAALPAEVSRVFVGLGLTVLQGYGMTETSPVACANRPDDNLPASVGRPVANVEVKIGASGALLVRGPNVMLGYWNNPEATRQIIDAEGWLNTGDTARIDADGRVFITGRLKEIIVLSNGEKVPPADMENAIVRDPLFEQVMLLGEAKPYLSVLAVVNADQWKTFSALHGLDGAVPSQLGSKKTLDLALQRVGRQLGHFPGYAQVRRATLTLEPWTVENGMLTPTLKLKRAKVMEKFRAEIDAMYEGH